MLELYHRINPKTTLKVDGNNPQEVFQNLATMQGVFSIDKCGCCGKDNLRYVARKAQGGKNKVFEYLEIWCLDCRAKLSFGVSDDGQIYPKTRMSQLAVEKSESDKKRAEECKEYADTHYGMLPNNGFFKYRPNQQQNQQQTSSNEEEGKTPF